MYIVAEKIISTRKFGYITYNNWKVWNNNIIDLYGWIEIRKDKSNFLIV